MNLELRERKSRQKKKLVLPHLCHQVAIICILMNFFFCFILEAFLIKALVTCKPILYWHVKHVLKIFMIMWIMLPKIFYWLILRKLYFCILRRQKLPLTPSFNAFRWYTKLGFEHRIIWSYSSCMGLKIKGLSKIQLMQ